MSTTGSRNKRKWQKKLLPFIISIILFLTTFFFVASFAQLYYLHTKIDINNNLGRDMLFDIPDNESGTFQEIIVATRLQAMIKLEVNAIDRRYHQANVLLMSRVWIRYLGFVTGMILSIIGSVFILAKFSEEESDLNAKINESSLSFKSTSPGLFMVGLGVALMLSTILTHHEISVTDTSIYLKEFDYSYMKTQEGSPPSLEFPKAEEQ